MPSKAIKEPRKRAWGRGAFLNAVGRWLTLAPSKNHWTNASVKSFTTRRGVSYQTSQNRESSSNQGDKRQGDDDRRVARVIPEDMVDLGQLAVTRGLDGGDRDVGVTVDGQLEDGAVVRLRAAERSDHHVGVDGIGEVEELERELLLGLDSC